MFFTDTQIAKIDELFQMHNQFLDKEFNAEEQYGNRRNKVQSYTFRSKQNFSVFFKVIVLNPDEQFHIKNNDGLSNRQANFDSFKIEFNVWLAKYTPEPKIESDPIIKNDYQENKILYEDFENSSNNDDYERTDLPKNELIMSDKTYDADVSLDYNDLVLRTKKFLQKKGKHTDCRKFWKDCGLESEDKQLQFRKNLAFDGIIHELDTDVWKIRLTANIGQKITSDHIDESGRFIKIKYPLTNKESPFGNKISNWIIGTQLTIILALIPMLISSIRNNDSRYDAGISQGYDQGKDTYSNEKVKWFDENSKLRTQHQKDSMEMQQLTKKFDSLLRIKN